MGIIIDIILIALLALSIFLGYKKGFVKVAIKLLAFIIAIVLTLILYKPVARIIIDNTQLDENIEKVIIENGTKEMKEGSEEEKNDFVESIKKYVEESVTKTQNEVVESAAVVISERAIEIGVFILLFILIRVALILLVLISDLITNIPIIKQFNKLGGIVYGIIRGLLLIYIILGITYFALTMSANTNVMDIINSSIFTKFMYNNNVILNIIF